jgi:outer membrane autotransporter protein
MDFTETGPGRFYTEASLRVGGIRNKFWSSDLRDVTGVSARYTSRSAYVGTHLGAGYLWNVAERATLDLHTKYFWTRQGNDSVTLSTGDPIRFKAANSHRLRFGSRLAFAANARVSPYVGGAFEHEFAGKARAFAHGIPIDAPSMRGGTGIGELGLVFRPSANRSLTADLGVQGYVGKRQGVTGALRVGWAF